MSSKKDLITSMGGGGGKSWTVQLMDHLLTFLVPQSCHLCGMMVKRLPEHIKKRHTQRQSSNTGFKLGVYIICKILWWRGNCCLGKTMKTGGVGKKMKKQGKGLKEKQSKNGLKTHLKDLKLKNIQVFMFSYIQIFFFFQCWIKFSYNITENC